jgi:hypothetical protein
MSNNDGGEEAFPRAEVVVAALTFLSLIVCGLCSLIYCYALLREKQAQAEEEDGGEAHESLEERIRIRKEYILNGLNVREWAPDDLQLGLTKGDQDTLAPSGEMVETPQSPAPTIISSPASCAIGSADCDSAARDNDCASEAGDEEMAGCAICLCEFKPEQLVCASNNVSCQHVFHKDCIVDWLVKQTENTCPMCREVYLIKAV